MCAMDCRVPDVKDGHGNIELITDQPKVLLKVVKARLARQQVRFFPS